MTMVRGPPNTDPSAPAGFACPDCRDQLISSTPNGAFADGEPASHRRVPAPRRRMLIRVRPSLEIHGLMRSLPKLEQFQAKAIAAHGLDLMKMQHVGKSRLGSDCREQTGQRHDRQPPVSCGTDGADDGGRTRTAKGRGILSPLRLPVSPRPHWAISISCVV